MTARNLMMAAAGASLKITYVGGYTIAFAGQTPNYTVTFGGNLTGGIASSASAGDLVIVYFGTGSTSDGNLVVAGYTELTELYANDTYDANLAVAYKFMGATPDTTFTLTGGTLSSTDAGAVAVQVWRNVDTILPFDVPFTTATEGGSPGTNYLNPPAITPATAGAVIVSGGAIGYATGAVNLTSSDLSGFLTSSANDTNDVSIGLGYYLWTSGAFDPAAFGGVADTSAASASVTLALRPKYTGTVPTFVASASTQNTTNGTSLVINKPTETAQGDLMIAVMSTNASGTWTGDTGWTEAADFNGEPALRIAYKIAGASEGASYTFTSNVSASTQSGCILTYRYAAYDTVGAYTSATNPLILPEITTAADFSILIATGSRGANSATLGTPTNMTARVTDNDGTAPSYIVCDQYVLAGATGTRSMTSGSTNKVNGIMLSIKPA